MKKLLLITLLFFSIHFNTNAQGTVLSPGDVAIVHYQADTPDEFAFITFVDLVAGTTIYFTDCGTINGASFLNPCNEGAQVFVATAPITAGTVIEWPSGQFSAHTDSRIAGSLALGTTGDQLIVFQDADGAGGTDPAQNPSFVFALNAGSTLFTGDPNSSNSHTGMPQGLAGFPNASLAVGSGTGPSDENDNSVFNTSLAPFASIAAAQTAILNPANWSPSQSTVTQPYATYAANVGSTTFVAAGCNEPDVPSSFNSAPGTICDGNSALLTWSGSLNDATNWHIYSGSCGGTLLGTTASNTFIVTPTPPSTQYFVRGEGGCSTPAGCAMITVTTTAREDASFNYSAASYAANETDPSPTITGVGGGNFTASPGGLSISPSTGMIDLDASTVGTYTVTYTTPGLCSDNSTQSVTVTNVAVATAAAGCNTYTGVGISGTAWINIVDGSGQIVAAINPNGTNLGTVTIEMDDRASVGVDGKGVHYLPRFFNFESTNFDGVGATFPSAVSIRLYYKGVELTDYNTAAGSALAMGDLIMSHYSGANEDCDITNNQVPTIATITDIIPTASVYNGTDFCLEFNVPHFSEIGAGAGGLMLPVELNSFSGRNIDNANELVWSTASELNFSHFEIQRSTDGLEFLTINEIQGQGNTADVSQYSYTDRDFTSSKNYYRLKMIDFDETFDYSNVVFIETERKGSFSISPNPAKNSIKIQLEFESVNNVLFTITSINGLKVMQGTLDGINKDLDISQLADGLYILSVYGNGIIDTIKFVKE